MGDEVGRPARGIAVDIGGSKIAIALADGGTVGRVLRLPTRAELGPDSLVERVTSAARRLAAPAAVARVVVASAGSLDAGAGVVRFASNLPFNNYPLAKSLSERLGAQVMLVGDTTAATVAEFSVRGRESTCHGVYVTVSTGIGMGMLLDGRIYTGNRGAAGELGHIPMVLRDPAACRCGQHGCLEAYASGAGLVDRARLLLAGGAVSVLAPVAARGGLSAKSIIEAASGGDAVAGGLLDDAIRLLAAAIATIFRMLGPELVVLGGGLMLSGDVVALLRLHVSDFLALERDGLDAILVPAAFEDRSALEGARAICRRDPRAIAMGVDFSWT